MDTPRENTEAHNVWQEVLKKKTSARNKGLDLLFYAAYHELLSHYPRWAGDSNFKDYIYPAVASIRKTFNERAVELIEFTIGNKNYKTTKGDNILALYLNGRKVFAVNNNGFGDIVAYVNDDWVDDFKEMVDYKNEVDRKARIESIENPEKIQFWKEDFGLNGLFAGKKNNIRVKDFKGQAGIKRWISVAAIVAIVIILLLILFKFWLFLYK